jgi:hypothetical protein
MPSSSSLNHRCSLGSSQVGTCGSGLSSRDRNTSRVEDTTTSHRNGRNDLSEQMQGTPPESQRGGNYQGPTNTPATQTCKQQLCDCNTVECDRLRDPEENRKRKLSQAITEILVSSLKKLKTEYVFLGFHLDIPFHSAFLQEKLGCPRSLLWCMHHRSVCWSICKHMDNFCE